MSHLPEQPPFPRGPLFGAGALIGIVLTAVALVRITGAGVTAAPVPPLAELDVLFIDRPDGGVTIYDARAERPLDVVMPGSNGFLRATLRGMARDRKRAGGGADTPFHLAALADGRLTLADPVTGHHVDLEAFGATNAGVFALLFKPGTKPNE